MSAAAASRIAFAGTPEFAVPSLQALLEAGYLVGPVYTQPDRPAGRGRKLTPSPVKQAALAHGIEVLQPERLDAAARQALPTVRPALLVVVAYGLLLPEWMLAWPLAGAINVHASLLPRWRGASPIQQAIRAGDTETGVSIMRMAPGLDRGPVYRTGAIPIGPAETAGELHDRLAVLGASLLLGALPGILDGSACPKPQDDAQASYAPRIDKREALIDWSRPAIDLEREIRAFNPWPIAEARTAAGLRLRIWQAHCVAEAVKADAGTVVGTGPEGVDVQTGSGLLRLTQIQPPGGRPMSAAAYLAAHALDGTVFVGPG